MAKTYEKRAIELSRTMRENYDVPLYFFHAVNASDFKEIVAGRGKIVAPSVGITRAAKSTFGYGPIVFIPGRDILEAEFTFWDRDVWTPTVRSVIHEEDRTGKKFVVGYNEVLGKKLFTTLKRYKYRLDYNGEDGVGWEGLQKEALGANDPTRVLDLTLSSNEWFDHSIRLILISLDLKSGGLDGHYTVFRRFLDKVYPKLKPTPKNISDALKRVHGGEMFGKESYHVAGYVQTAVAFRFGDLSKHIDKLLSEEELVGKNGMGDAVREKQQQLVFDTIKSTPPFRGEWSSYMTQLDETDTLLGKIAGKEDVGSAWRLWVREKADTSSFSGPRDSLFTELWENARNAYALIKIPYFEGKTLDALSWANFPVMILNIPDLPPGFDPKEGGYPGKVFGSWEAYQIWADASAPKGFFSRFSFSKIAVPSDLLSEVKKYKSFEKFEKDFMILFHGGSKEVIGGKLVTHGRRLGKITPENLSKGQDYGGIFFTPELSFAKEYAIHSSGDDGGAVHTFVVKISKMFIEDSPRDRARLRAFVGKKFLDEDEEIVFTEQMRKYMMPNHMDWSTFNGDVLRAMGYNGAKIIENYIGPLHSYVLFGGGAPSPHWEVPDGSTLKSVWEQARKP